MRVVARDESGEWTAWRVGRRRLAWRPRYAGWHLDADDEWGIALALNLIPLAGYLLNWAAALLVTTIVWPVRAAAGRWTVVAYPTTDDDRSYRTTVRGRRAADALAHRWELEIKQYGRPQLLATGA
ncbi:hypothetical protein ABZ671_28340 [Micromonospora sp. NPDC006766]|uniref:hypothetical protein n=1 Tax=Micromonospora sp. NPDC006766 TaxID=3154778 RepID=UPI003407EEED